MQTIDKIYECVNSSTMILIISDKKLLLNSLLDSIYKKYIGQKTIFDSRKNLMQKLTSIKGKLIKLNYDLGKVQFRSSRNQGLGEDFQTLKLCLTDNFSKILISANSASSGLQITDSLNNISYYYDVRINREFDAFDLVIFIDKKDIKLIRYSGQNRNIKKEENIINIDTLIRSTKLKQLQKSMNDENRKKDQNV